jgi:hypothetical protein
MQVVILIPNPMSHLQWNGAQIMHLKRTEAKLKLLEDITKAIKEAHDAGIRNPLELLKKALDSRIKYKNWKKPKTK